MSDELPTAFVITCNDSVEAVVVGPRWKAESERQRRKDDHFNNHRRNWEDRGRHYGMSPQDAHHQSAYWAVREVPLIGSEK